MERLVRELFARPSPAEIEAALGSLAVSSDGGTTTISRERAPSTPLFGALAVLHAPRVRLLPGVYPGIPTSAARVRVLEAAAAIAPEVVVHAPVLSTGTHRGRLAIDLPRRLARALGAEAAEPGDRFTGGFVHALFDDETLIEEARRAGLAFLARRGAWVVLARAAVPVEHLAPFSAELARALALVREAERLRVRDTPERAVVAMRSRGRTCRRRGPIGRARLRRAIGWVDAVYTRPPNCLRRTLLELGLDAGAADETLVFGLDVGRTGHVAFKDAEEQTFDVAFEVPPRDPAPEERR